MPNRLVRALLLISALLMLLAPTISLNAFAQPNETLYVGHGSRLTASIPTSWTRDRAGAADYSGPEGFIASNVIEGATLDDACANAVTSTDGTVSEATWSGKPACTIDGTILDRESRTLVIPHPEPFNAFGLPYSFVFIATDPAHFESITDSISFDPSLVTPQAYIDSVIDILQARAYFGDGIDWEFVRNYTLSSIDGLTTIELVHGTLLNLLQTLRANGDNHSGVSLPDNANALQESSGFGMHVGGDRIIAVYPNSPAGHAGLQVGDVVLSVNGEPARPVAGDDPGISYTTPQAPWPSPATLIAQRSGEPEPFEVTIEANIFEFYRPPTGYALPGALGYIDVPLYRIPGRETEFAQTGAGIIADIDRQAHTCGWIVDLRLNLGGSYYPMISAIGSILGNGTFVGWQNRDGVTTTWVTYKDGVIRDNNHEIANYFPKTGPPNLQQPNPPVAVLTSSFTGSSGEVATLAFVNRPNARSFGETTGGYATAVQTYRLFDGSLIGLAAAAMVDRSGETHLAGVIPDRVIPIDWATYGTESDPVMIAAQQWLLQQPDCISATPAA